MNMCISVKSAYVKSVPTESQPAWKLKDYILFISVSYHLLCLFPHRDGQKMSKRKKNYPDPLEVVAKHGADAIRLYLINSPVVRADNLRFKEEGVRDVVKDVFLPWFNAYRFLMQNIDRLKRV